MISKKLQDAINDQIKNEFYSSYVYLAMAAWCESNILPGAAKWLAVQAKEEWGHGMRLYNFLHDRNGHVVLQGVEKPPADYKSFLDVFENVLKHERKVTAMIDALYEVAVAEKDYPAQIELQWFITEQVEEEKNATLIVDQLKAIPEKSGAMYYLDHHLGKRADK